MSQPALALAVAAAHRLIAREKVLDRPRQAVPGMRHTVGGGGPFVEDELRSAGATGERLLIDLALAPEVEHLLFEGGKVGGGRGTKHRQLTEAPAAP